MKKYLWTLALLVVGITLLFGVIKKGTAGDGENVQQEGKVVKTAAVTKANLEEMVEFAGFVKHEKEVLLSSEAAGRLLSLNKQEGERVKKGELLAKIDAEEFLAQAALNNKQIAVAEDGAKETDDYYDQLVDEAEVALEKAENAYSSAKKGSDSDKKRLAKRDLEAAEEALKSAKRLRDLQNSLANGETEVYRQQALLNQIQIKNTQITAPFDGVIAKRYGEEGVLVMPGKAIFMLVNDTDNFEIELKLPLEIGESLKIGQELSAENEKGETRKLLIKSASPVADQVTRKIGIKAQVSGEELAPGEFLTVAVPSKIVQDVILVPVGSIFKDYHEEVVFVVKGGVAEKKKVELGISNTEFVEIKNGLELDEIVVVEGQQKLIGGDKVKIYEQ